MWHILWHACMLSQQDGCWHMKVHIPFINILKVKNEHRYTFMCDYVFYYCSWQLSFPPLKKKKVHKYAGTYSTCFSNNCLFKAWFAFLLLMYTCKNICIVFVACCHSHRFLNSFLHIIWMCPPAAENEKLMKRVTVNWLKKRIVIIFYITFYITDFIHLP